MKYLLYALLLIGLNFTAYAESEKYDALLQSAKSESKYIAVYFSGSDWCTKCVTFKKKYLENDAIQALLDTDYIFYTADFPQRKKLEKDETAANETLAERLNPDGIFPLLVITDTDMNIIAAISSGSSTDETISILEQHKSTK